MLIFENKPWAYLRKTPVVILSVCFLILVNVSIVTVIWGSGAETHDSP